MTIQPTEDEVVSYFDKLSNWGRWGPDDRLGTLNLVTDEARRAAARLIRDGQAVSLSRDMDPARTLSARSANERWAEVS